MKDVAYFDSLDFEALLDDLAGGEEQSSYSSTDESRETVNKSDNCVVLSADSTASKDRPLFSFFSKPKILRSDIRRSYMEMLANVLNSGDFPLTYGFLDTYCAPNFEEYAINYNPITNQPYFDRFQGAATVAKMFCATYRMSPDAVFSIADTKVYLSSNTAKCKIVATFSIRATKILDVATDKVFEPENMAQQCHTSTSTSSSTAMTERNKSRKRKGSDSEHQQEQHQQQQLESKRAVIASIQKSIDNVTETMPLTANPVQINLQSTMTMYVDEDKFITRVVMDGAAQVRKEVMDAHCPFCSAKRLFSRDEHVNTVPFLEGH